jgi:hypothetical protein
MVSETMMQVPYDMTLITCSVFYKPEGLRELQCYRLRYLKLCAGKRTTQMLERTKKTDEICNAVHGVAMQHP